MRSILIILLFLLISCNYSAGTLGSFPAFNFPVSREHLQFSIDSLYRGNPQYKIPEKWIDKDNWSERGYDFLESRIFYFSDNPEEMYYVTFEGKNFNLDDKTNAVLAIRAVINKNSRWLKFDEIEIERRNQIQKRFYDEIISKLEMITGSKYIKID